MERDPTGPGRAARRLAALPVLLALNLGPAPAAAQFLIPGPYPVIACTTLVPFTCHGSADWGAATATISSSIMDTLRGFSDMIAAKNDELVTALDDVKTVLAGARVKQTEAMGRMLDAEQMERTKRQIGERAVMAEQRFSTDTALTHCQTGTGALDLGGAMEGLETGCAAAPQPGASARGGASPRRTMSARPLMSAAVGGDAHGLANRGAVGLTEDTLAGVLTNRDAAASEGQDRWIAARFDGFSSRYCNPESFADFDAGEHGELCKNLATEYIDADIKFGNTLLFNRTLSEKEEQQASDDLLLNLAGSNVPEPIPASLFGSPTTRAALMARRFEAAHGAIGTTALGAIKEMRLPTVNRDNGTGSWIDQIAGSTPVGTLPDRISLYQVLEALMFTRYTTEDWWTAAAKLEVPAIKREVVYMMATRQMLAWKQYQMLELLAAQNASHFGRSTATSSAGVTALEN